MGDHRCPESFEYIKSRNAEQWDRSREVRAAGRCSTPPSDSSLHAPAQPMPNSQTHFEVPPPALSAGFEWVQGYDELLQQTAESNVVDADWPILKDMIKFKIAENVKSYLSMGPPWPLQPEAAFDARERAYAALDGFDAPPFTIQRLCELTLAPRQHYSSLPKWLRALDRVLSVSSPRHAFTETDPSEPLPVPPQYEQLTASTSSTTLDDLANGNVATRRPGAREETPAPGTPNSGPNAPLLSPIPWLVKDKVNGSSLPEPDAMDLSEGGPSGSGSQGSPTAHRVASAFSLSPPSQHSAHLGPAPPGGQHLTNNSSPPKPLTTQSSTTTPTGGLVDEVDPGSGTGEVAEPVALTHSASVAGGGGGGAGSPGLTSKVDELREVESLSSRFVRASSPRVEGVGSPRSE